MRWGKRFLVFGVCYGTFRLAQQTGLFDFDAQLARVATKINEIKAGRA